MIPKIVHFCWLSNDPFPEKIQKCIDSWYKMLPDYEIVLWNFDRFPHRKSKWVDQAFENHKFAFAADYIRLYALYNYGGIYLDSDVEVLKNFDDLLDLPYFIGQENTPSGIEAATLGCEKGNKLVGLMLSRYEDRPFIKSNGDFDTKPLPFIFRNCIDTQFSYNLIRTKSDFKYDEDVINVFPIDWFSPKTWNTKVLDITENTYSIHHFAGSWLDEKVADSLTDEVSTINFDNSTTIYKTDVKNAVLPCLKKILINRNIVFLSKSTFIDAFCGFFELKDSMPLRMIDINPSGCSELISFLSKDKHLYFTFERVSDFSQINGSDYFYPVGKHAETNSFIHFTSFTSRNEVMDYCRNLNFLLKNYMVVAVKEKEHWNFFSLLLFAIKLNIISFMKGYSGKNKVSFFVE